MIPAGFGRESAKRHREYAVAAGAELREIPLPSLSLDIDAPEDLDAFLATPWGGRRTRELLHRLESTR